jgi:6-phosphogluconolactonase
MLSPNNPPEVYTKVGSGPRHFALAPDNKFLFLSNERDGTIYSFKIDKQTGVLNEVQRLPILPSNKGNDSSLSESKGTQSNTNKKKVENAGVADIHVAPNGKWLYVSERVNNTISLFTVNDKTGNLIFGGNYKTETTPRGFNIDPSGNYLLAAGQKSGYVSVYTIDQRNGELKFKHRIESGKDPNWIEIVNFR